MSEAGIYESDDSGEIESLRARVAELESAVEAVDELIRESTGVAGLHLNGEVAPWSDLLQGGRYEEWLAPLSAALEGK